MAAAHITAGRIAKHADHSDCEQALVNGMVVEFGDEPGSKTISSPIYIDGVAKSVPTRAPDIGEHNAAILAEFGIGSSD
jgi:crotonobetainyl-CoA:carnitine CoA-transferase CaiB-like acyl-CoA transferase